MATASTFDAPEVTPAKPERPLHERALASVNAYATRLPKASVDLLFEAMARLAVLERERARPPRPGIQVEVADDLDVMSLAELCERFNTQRTTIGKLIDENRALLDKGRRLDDIKRALDV